MDKYYFFYFGFPNELHTEWSLLAGVDSVSGLILKQHFLLGLLWREECQALFLNFLPLNQPYLLEFEGQLFTGQLEKHKDEITYKYEKTFSPTNIASNSSLRTIKKISF